jgi:rhamnosyltransferase
VTGSEEPRQVCALVTAYQPDGRLAAVVESALTSCAAVIVADNTPGDRPSMADKLDDPRVTVLRSGHNLGLAAALNLGLGALPPNVWAVLLLDQDSVLPPGTVPGLLAHLQRDETVGVVGPGPVDAEGGGQYETLAKLHAEVAERYSIITSGMLVRRSCLDALPAPVFREDFFVDCVDLDFCFKIRRAGLRVLCDQGLPLPHSIGEGRDHRVLGRTVRVLHYPAWRHYWIARNGMVLTRERGLHERAFALINLLFMTRWLIVTAAFEPKRRSHVPAVLRGLRDGLAGRVDLAYLPPGAEYRGRPGHGG